MNYVIKVLLSITLLMFGTELFALTGPKNRRPPEENEHCNLAHREIFAIVCTCGQGVLKQDPADRIWVQYQFICDPNVWSQQGESCHLHLDCDPGDPVYPTDKEWTSSGMPRFGVYSPFDRCVSCL